MTGAQPYLPRGAASPSGAGCWDRPEGFYSTGGGASSLAVTWTPSQRVRPSKLAPSLPVGEKTGNTSLSTPLGLRAGGFLRG